MSRKLGSHLESTKKPSKLIPGTPEKSKGLSVRASAEWDRLLDELSRSGLTLTPAHRALVTLAATLSADIRSCWNAIEANGSEYIQAGTGALKLHPAVSRLDGLRRDLAKVLSSLGLEKPVAEEEEEGETLEDVLNG